MLSKKHAPWIVGAWFLIVFLLVSPQYPLNFQSPLSFIGDEGEFISAPDGYKWCAGYEYLENRLVPENIECPNEYLCISLNESFTVEEEARMACPTEWTVYADPLIVEAEKKKASLFNTEAVVVMVSVLALLGLHLATRGGKNGRKK